MPIQVHAIEMLTGRKITPLPVSKAKWKVTTNADESITCTVPAADPRVVKLDPWGATTLARNGLLVVVDGFPVAAGPIWRRKLDLKTGSLELTAGGLRSYFNRRVAVPVSALGAGEPDPAFDTRVTNLSLATVAKRYVQLAQAWPGGSIPMVLPADEARPGRDITVKAVDLKKVGDLIDDLSGIENGPDFAFQPRFSADGLGIYWEMRTGTETNPRIGSLDAGQIRWSYGAPKSPAFDLVIEEDATEVASQGWAVGGAGVDQVLAARASLDALPAAGFPLLEATSTGNSTVTRQENLEEKAAQLAYLGQFVSSFWNMRVAARSENPARPYPKLGDWWLGDLATVDIDRREKIIPTGSSVRRIASIEGDELDDSYSIAFAEALI
jgi:hypothetical protein